LPVSFLPRNPATFLIRLIYDVVRVEQPFFTIDPV